MGLYNLGMKPLKSQRSLENLLKELGHHPYLAQQPNGWSDLSQDWMSPELLIRRLVYAKQAYFQMKPKNQNNEFYEEMIAKNIDKPEEIKKILAKNNNPYHKHVILFNLPEMLKS